MTECASDCVESLDPRVQIELERLNTATDNINKLEVELDEARLIFRQLLIESNFRIQQLTKKFGASIQKSRPYYEARFRANVASQEMQAAAMQYDKANSAHSAAREMVYLAEQGLCRLGAESDAQGAGVSLDPAWQEMLNHATSRVNQAESERAAAGTVHRARVATYRAAVLHASQLQSNLKRQIAKSRPYFEEKARINTKLDSQKTRIQQLEREVAAAKLAYAAALRALERISDEIHRHRSTSHSAAQSETSRAESVRSDDIGHAQINGSPLRNNTTNAESEPKNPLQCKNEDSIREWLEHPQNESASPLDDQPSPNHCPNYDYKQIAEKMTLIRPKSLPQDFQDKYTELLTPIQPSCNPKVPYSQQGNQLNSLSTPSAQSRNGQDSDNWTEINLEYSSPEEISFEKCSNFSGLETSRQIPYERMAGDLSRGNSMSQRTTPEDEGDKSLESIPRNEDYASGAKYVNSRVSACSPRRIIKVRGAGSVGGAGVNGSDVASKRNNSLKGKLRPDIANWIKRSSAKQIEEDLQQSPTRRQSFDVILNDTGEKVKEIFSQGFLMFNISSLTERRNSEPRLAQTEKLSPTQRDALDSQRLTASAKVGGRKMPSPLDKTLSYLSVYGETGAGGSSDDQGSDTDSLASVEMLTDEQIHSLMLDGQLEAICSQLLGVAVSESTTDEAAKG